MACLHSYSLPLVKDKLTHFSVMEKGSSTTQILLSLSHIPSLSSVPSGRLNTGDINKAAPLGSVGSY